MKLSFFGEELLDKLLDDQKRVLLSKVPESCPDFTMEDYTAVLKVLCSIDEHPNKQNFNFYLWLLE